MKIKYHTPFLIGLVKDESAKFDGYNWHDEYAKWFSELGCKIDFLDFKKSGWQEYVEKGNHSAFMWRAWHVPHDRDDARRKIYYIEQVLNKIIFPTWNMYWCYDDKISQLSLLRKYKIPHPPTFFTRDLEEAKEFSRNAKLPVVAKCSEGACGQNVRLIEDRRSLLEYIDYAFSDEGMSTYFNWVRQKGYVYLQEYLPIEKDMRIITIGESAEFAVWIKGESWINFGENASVDSIGIPQSALNLCKEVSKKLGFHWCAYDVANYKGKDYIFEFSSIFGFSFKEQYFKLFGSPNAWVLKKQSHYVVNLLEKREW
jgi:hypothetical protein